MINKLTELIRQSNHIVFFGGAGVSTESGIPDFRSKDGLYNTKDIRFEGYAPEYLLSHTCLYEEPNVFYEYYRQKLDFRDVKPNITHYVLADMEKKGKLDAIITQNIDGLHQKAGSKNVIEIHGTSLKNYCAGCNMNFPSDYIFTHTNFNIPRCPQCGNLIRPDIVLYCESLPYKAMNDASNAIAEADLIIIGGTSMSVYPANTLIPHWKSKNCKTVIINKEETEFDNKCDLVIHDNLGNVFANII